MSSDFGSHSRDVTSAKKDVAESAVAGPYYKEPTAWSFQPGRPMSGLRLNVNAIIQPVKTFGPAKRQRAYIRPTCSYLCLIGIAMKYSPLGTMPVDEIYKFVCHYFPYFRATGDLRWKRMILQKLLTNDFFETEKVISVEKGLYRLRAPLQEIAWRVDPQKVTELDRVVGSWASSNPSVNSRSMSRPGELEKLMRYRDVPYLKGEEIIIVDDDDDEEEEVIVLIDDDEKTKVIVPGDDDVVVEVIVIFPDDVVEEGMVIVPDDDGAIEEEVIVPGDEEEKVVIVPDDDDDDDDPFGMVTLTADDVHYRLAKDCPFEERLSSSRKHDSAVHRGITDVQENRRDENNKPRKKKAVKRPMNAFMLFAKAKRRKFSESNPSMPGVDVTRLLGMTWRHMNLKEQIPYIRAAERLRDEHYSQIPDKS